MNKEVLTEKEFWFNYWKSKKSEILQVKKTNSAIHQLLDEIVEKNDILSAIELGGFPGEFSIHLFQKHGIESTLLDYYIDSELFKELLKVNKIDDPEAIGLIEFDLLSDNEPTTKYELVYSLGLIEHFKDTSGIMAKHLVFLKSNGTLLIEIPNFRGVNGWIQKTFDKENYSVHNIDCMDPDYLKSIATNLGLKDVSANYFGKFGIWLEKRDTRNAWVRFVIKVISIAGKVISKVAPFDNRFMSPYIVLKGTK